MRDTARQSGFTLVEVAVVLVIVGVLMGSFIGTFSNRIEVSRRDDTRKELRDIKQALVGYAYANGYLPCPDVSVPPDGIEDRDGFGRCSAYIIALSSATGTFPWVSLGMGGADAWNTRYSYWVDFRYADTAAATGAAPAGDVFDLTTGAGAGAMLEPDYVADPDGGTLKNLAQNVVAVVISHGKNTLGGTNVDGVASDAPQLDELENTDTNGQFVSRPPTTGESATDGGEFDDILIWVNEYEIKAKMVEAGLLP